MSFPRYREYLPTGNSVIPRLPLGWSVVLLRNVGQFLKGRGGSKQDSSDSGVPCIRYGELYTTFSFSIRSPRGFVPSELAGEYQPISKGDVLFASSGEDMADIGKSAVNLLEGPTVCGGDLVILRPTIDVLPEFLGFACDSIIAKAQKAMMGRGTTVKHIYPDELRQVVIALPPRRQQEGIVSFLDRETAKIDALIAEQERLIALLQEKRQAVISHAVTKGLDPNVPMKDSGMEWIGRMPTHWSLQPLRTLECTVRTGPFGSQLHAEEYIESGVPVINPAHIRGGEIEPDESITVGPEVVERLAHQRLVADDVIFARRGELGRCALIREREAGWLCGTGCMVLKLPAERMLPQFLTVLLGTFLFRQHFESLSIGATIDSLSSRDLLTLPVLVPPIEEQRAICANVSETECQFTDLVAAAKRGQLLLAERRTALITAAVTGQIDVRGLVETAA